MARLSNDDFRSDLPEFTDSTAFPEGVLTYWMNLGLLMLNPARWGEASQGGTDPRTEFDIGLEMFMAHNIVLEAAARRQQAAGNQPGIAQGPVTSKSVDGVSISYNTEAGIEIGAGHWNNTVYGQRFIRMVKMYGAGGLQISGGGCMSGVVSNGFGSGMAWSGPNCLPGWFGS